MTAPLELGGREAGRAYDKTGREIRVGDVLKVYHFTGARWRKRYFMFKQVIGECTLGPDASPYLQVSHLAMKPFGERDGGYWLAQDGTHHPDIEIVQGLDWHHDRTRVTPPAQPKEPRP
jgi:hypothetical protein